MSFDYTVSASDDAGGPPDNKRDDITSNAQTYAPKTVAGDAQQENKSQGPQSPIVTFEGVEGPGKRLGNPLSKLSSYTYQISLYMVTADAYNQFASTRRTILPTVGVFLVAQSGGIDSTTSKRAKGFEFDHYIDDLKVDNLISGTATTQNIGAHSFSFNVYEPYSFRFINNLWKAFAEINTTAKLVSDGTPSPLKQIYILGIRFLGYDDKGNIVTERKGFEDADSNQGLGERYYDMMISSIKFKVDGKMVVYTITGVNPGVSVGAGTAIATIDNTVKVAGTTVHEALTGSGGTVNGLLTTLNTRQENLTKSTVGNQPRARVANVFKVEYDGPIGELIKNSPIVDINDVDKRLTPMTRDVINVRQVNDATSASNKATPTLNVTSVTINGATAIAQGIASIIKRSKYIIDTLKVKQDPNQEEPKNGNAAASPKNNDKPSAITRWFRIGVDIKILAWDSIINDWAYEITYIIYPYDIPASQSPYATNVSKYYGPVKKYEYWYTGKNTEVIRYEQQIDGMYYVSDRLGGQNPNSPVPHRGNQITGGDNQGTLNSGMTPQNSIEISLSDPGFAQSRLLIMGDPDWLMQPGSRNPDKSINQSSFYGLDGYTVNSDAKQVFIEIDFNEGLDYDNSDGLFNTNEAIKFYSVFNKTPPVKKGISYSVNQVISNFSKGKFTQELKLSINFNAYNKEELVKAENEQRDAEAAKNDIEAENKRLSSRGATSRPGATTTPQPLFPATSPTPTTGLVFPPGVTTLPELMKQNLPKINPKTALPIVQEQPTARRETAGREGP